MAAPRQLPETVLVGLVRRPHGIRGEVAVEALTEHPARFAPKSQLTAVTAGGRRRTLTVAASRPHKESLLVTFAEIADRDAAKEIQGASLEVERRSVPPAEPSSYYHYELLGCRCIDAVAGPLGEVVDLVEDGGGLLLVISGPEGEVPVPFVASFLAAVNVEAGIIELKLPPGLIEICNSRS